jgi:hypothetical protein
MPQAIVLPSQPVAALFVIAAVTMLLPVHWHPQRMECRDLHGLRTLPTGYYE